MSRGLRNNNPGNIRRSVVRYRGEVESADRAFKQFGSMAWGYRAMFVVLQSYRRRHKLQTLGQMIARYAPPCENDTDGYAAFVARRAGISVDTAVDVGSRRMMTGIVAAMSRVENGVDAVADDVEAGWELFIKHRP